MNITSHRRFICVHPNGAPIRPDCVTPQFQRRLKEVGFPVIRLHDLRHSVVYALRKGGCDAKDIQAWLGHSNILTESSWIDLVR
ncbi:MAG: tyrosine-type recombinase/integrase [Oscillospiraceae bacterium]|nr:tyrosine-type recombinase/integrase [Oscillospiraceae bacterium]